MNIQLSIRTVAQMISNINISAIEGILDDKYRIIKIKYMIFEWYILHNKIMKIPFCLDVMKNQQRKLIK